MHTKVILFDLDGVLVDACEIHYGALNLALSSVAGIKISRKSHEETYDGLSTRQKLSLLVRRGQLLQGQVDLVYREKQRHTLDVARGTLRKDEVKVFMCQRLQDEGFRLGCVSNCVRDSVNELLSLVGVWPFMECTVSNQDVQNPKPSGEGYRRAIGWFQQSIPIVEDSEIVAIEDNEKGVMAAQDAGIKVIKMDFPDVNLLNVLTEIQHLE